jgi:hypothetical protein
MRGTGYERRVLGPEDKVEKWGQGGIPKFSFFLNLLHLPV